MNILVANLGSTSFKYCLFRMPEEQVLARGKVERIGSQQAALTHQAEGRPALAESFPCADHHAAIQRSLHLLLDAEHGVLAQRDEIAAVGFKPILAKNVVEAVPITDEVIAAMEEYYFLAPAHNPPYLRAFRAFHELLPGKPQVGVFESHFHRDLPEAAYIYGIPYEWYERHGIRRYGFHGASHRYVATRAPGLAGLRHDRVRLISCHLGGSSSLCAIKDGVSIDTSMGLTPQAGIINATRCGDLDPFIIPFVMQQEGLSAQQVCDILTTRGGLLGISGMSGDVRDLREAASQGHRRAALALAVLVRDVKKYIGAYAALLGGLDLLAFTGGIGERAPDLRWRICEGLEFLGLRLHPSRNQASETEGLISHEDSSVKVVVVLANEELIIARETLRIYLEMSEKSKNCAQGIRWPQ